MVNPIVENVRSWLSSMVIGLDLCPFAKAVFDAGTIRYAVCPSHEPADLLQALASELTLLEATPRSECETTLLIAPAMLPDFQDFIDVVGVAEELVTDLGLSGVIQIVAFHPRFRFAGADENAPKNYTNRSPYPLIHLLREVSVSEVADGTIRLSDIPRQNTATLEKMGIANILSRLKG